MLRSSIPYSMLYPLLFSCFFLTYAVRRRYAKARTNDRWAEARGPLLGMHVSSVNRTGLTEPITHGAGSRNCGDWYFILVVNDMVRWPCSANLSRSVRWHLPGQRMCVMLVWRIRTLPNARLLLSPCGGWTFTNIDRWDIEIPYGWFTLIPRSSPRFYLE